MSKKEEAKRQWVPLAHSDWTGLRLFNFFEQRLLYSYDVTKKYINDNNLQNYDNYLCTTLSISPHKDAKLIYDIGKTICNESDIMYLPSDFKKEDGFLISIRLAKKYNLYRQNYCGCEFSKLN